jgi:TfoX/Sxy family transcriptional regulator of competence genes
MAIDEHLADRVRQSLARRPDITEKKMFGGLAFLLHGNMCCCVMGQDLMVRVGPAAYEDALAKPHARIMDFTKKPLKGYLYVGPKGVATAAALREWLARATDFVGTLPPK